MELSFNSDEVALIATAIARTRNTRDSDLKPVFTYDQMKALDALHARLGNATAAGITLNHKERALLVHALQTYALKADTSSVAGAHRDEALKLIDKLHHALHQDQCNWYTGEPGPRWPSRKRRQPILAARRRDSSTAGAALDTSRCASSRSAVGLGAWFKRKSGWAEAPIRAGTDASFGTSDRWHRESARHMDDL
jgi:hypothetical protein